jgi:hypothetical protein
MKFSNYLSNKKKKRNLVTRKKSGIGVLFMMHQRIYFGQAFYFLRITFFYFILPPKFLLVLRCRVYG